MLNHVWFKLAGDTAERLGDESSRDSCGVCIYEHGNGVRHWVGSHDVRPISVDERWELENYGEIRGLVRPTKLQGGTCDTCGDYRNDDCDAPCANDHCDTCGLRSHYRLPFERECASCASKRSCGTCGQLQVTAGACDACQTLEREPQGDAVKLFEPAPEQMPGQLGMMF